MYLEEVLSVAQRMKKSRVMKRVKAKIQRARERSLKRRATVDKLKKRARRSAVNDVKKKLAGGKDVNKLSMGDKKRIETIMKKRKNVIDRLAKRKLKDVRNKERERHMRKEAFEEFDENLTMCDLAEKYGIPDDLLYEAFQIIFEETEDVDTAMNLLQFTLIETDIELKEEMTYED